MWASSPVIAHLTRHNPAKGLAPTPTLPRGEGVKNDSGDLRSPGPRPRASPLDPNFKGSAPGLGILKGRSPLRRARVRSTR